MAVLHSGGCRKPALGVRERDVESVGSGQKMVEKKSEPASGAEGQRPAVWAVLYPRRLLSDFAARPERAAGLVVRLGNEQGKKVDKGEKSGARQAIFGSIWKDAEKAGLSSKTFGYLMLQCPQKS
jgi:hypothetical protein